MGYATAIEWTHHSFNPWRGCTKVSAGCANCYAETLSARNPKVLGVWGDKGTRVVASESMWREPLKWNAQAERAGQRRRVFCASLADVFERRDELIAPRARLLKLIRATPWLDWLLLTKRPENVLECVKESDAGYWSDWRFGYRVPENVWLGFSAENQTTFDERFDHARQIPCVVRFASLEPLLGPIDISAAYWIGECYDPGTDKGYPVKDRGLEWVIVGGESGPLSRACRVSWVRSLVAQCRAAAIPCFVKQLGAVAIGPESYRIRLAHPKGGDPSEWPSDLRVREFPR